ncbi:MAG: hypothetical protein Aurels2KO_47830 [Aureliella sp.]
MHVGMRKRKYEACKKPAVGQTRRRLGALLLAATMPLTPLAFSGCRRSFHYRGADQDAYCYLAEKGRGPNWDVESDFKIQPDQRSRFYDPACRVDPSLPSAAPQLYNYRVPELQTPDAAQRDLTLRDRDQYEARDKEPLATPPTASEPTAEARQISLYKKDAYTGVQLASAKHDDAWDDATVKLASPILTALIQQPPGAEDVSALPTDDESETDAAFELTINPIPPEVWQSLPATCTRRMLEFDTVRGEYYRTFGKEVDPSQLDPSKRVNLENILELALINNRAYQTRKEALYRTALQLSFQRFQYQLRPFSRGNGTDLGYVHNRVGGVEVNRLSTPTRLGVSKSLYTAGNLVTRFANDVVLTFNGASGYSSTVGSELLVDLSQPLIQRDIQFEPLTQSERDVVYAARDYVRFRKELFRDLAVRYYNLLLTYRRIAIDTQDYFSNRRGFERSEALERAGEIPRFQVDQFEQNTLASRGSLVNSCNSLEGALDRLKLAIGLPTEMPLNLDLSELEELTLRDEAAVVEEQVRRKLDYVQRQRKRNGPRVAITSAAELLRRMQNLERLRERLGEGDPDLLARIGFDLRRLEMEALRLVALASEAELQKLFSPATINMQEEMIFGRKLDYASSTIRSIEAQLELHVMRLQQLSEAGNVPEAAEYAARQLSIDFAKLTKQFSDIKATHKAVEKIPEDLLAILPQAILDMDAVVSKLKNLEQVATQVLIGSGIAIDSTDEHWDRLTLQVVGGAGEVLARTAHGLSEIEVDVDEAMLTALVQRLDLMNQRGELADRWRDIKYTGDALKGIVNVRGTQSLRTPAGGNKPLDFSFDDSTTTLGLEFDTPLNRRAERNSFRLALINYNAALRNVIEAEDSIKLDIRDDLRSLDLDRNQYEISVASAALAYERVVSTRLQLITPGSRSVSARDFLESQQAYTRSLSSVAQQHIGFVIDRIQFFLDLEQLQVDELNFWPELRDEQYPFLPNLDFAGTVPRPYDSLSAGPWYSKCMRRMERAGGGYAMSHREDDAPESMTVQPEPLPPPPPVARPSTAGEGTATPVQQQPAPTEAMPLDITPELIPSGTIAPLPARQ